MKIIALLLLGTILLTPVMASTLEVNVVSNEVTTTSSLEPLNVGKFWQEFDITFWQSLPFATLWGHLFERQAANYLYPGIAARWDVIMTFAVVTSVGNAWFHASSVSENERKRHNN